MTKAKDQWFKVATKAGISATDDIERIYFLSKRLHHYDKIATFDRELTEPEKRLESKYDLEIQQLMSDYGFTSGYKSSDRWFEYCDPRGNGGIRIGFNGCPGNNMGDSESWDIGGFSNVFKA